MEFSDYQIKTLNAAGFNVSEKKADFKQVVLILSELDKLPCYVIQNRNGLRLTYSHSFDWIMKEIAALILNHMKLYETI